MDLHHITEGVLRRHLFVGEKVAADDAICEIFHQGRHRVGWHIGESTLAEHNRGQGVVEVEVFEERLEAF